MGLNTGFVSQWMVGGGDKAHFKIKQRLIMHF
ncbi:Uncharacterised protein [Vibrio cholerae]|nr:Uncharacterised protein [Vibrio cholerae]